MEAQEERETQEAIALSFEKGMEDMRGQMRQRQIGGKAQQEQIAAVEAHQARQVTATANTAAAAEEERTWRASLQGAQWTATQ